MKKKRTKTSQRRLNNMLIILVLTAVLMVMSTYAWFTANRTVSLQALTVKATTTNGLQISSGTSAWSNSMQQSDLTDAYTLQTSTGSGTKPGVVNMLAYNFNNVSTALGQYALSSSGDQGLVFYLGKAYQSDTADSSGSFPYVLETVNNADGGTSVKETNFAYNSSGGYDASAPMMAFDFFLKYTGSASPLYAKVNVQPNSAGSKDIEMATRVAFVIGTPVTATDYDTTFTPDASSTGSGFATFHTNVVSGGTSAKVVAFEPWANKMGSKTSTNSSALGLTASVPQTVTYGIKQAISTPQSLISLFGGSNSNTAAVTYVQPDSSASNQGEVSTQVFDGSASSAITEGITKVRCYIWIEGQDYDCQNGATGGLFDVSFEFSLDNT